MPTLENRQLGMLWCNTTSSPSPLYMYIGKNGNTGIWGCISSIESVFADSCFSN